MQICLEVAYRNKYGLSEILLSEIILATCICTENPPNPRTKATIGSFSIKLILFNKDNIFIPLVISKIPQKIPLDISFGKLKIPKILSIIDLNKFEIPVFAKIFESTAKNIIYPSIISSVVMLF